MGKISKWILNSLAVGAIQAQDFEVTNCEDANVSLIRRIRVTESKHFVAKYVARRKLHHYFCHIKSHFYNLKLFGTYIFRVFPPYLLESLSNTLMLISMLIKMISLWIMGTMRRHLREVLSIWFMMMSMTVRTKIIKFNPSNVSLNILIVFLELILSYTLGTPQTQHIALNSNVNLRYFNMFSQSTWLDFKFFKSIKRGKVWVPVSDKNQWFEYWFCSYINEYRY